MQQLMQKPLELEHRTGTKKAPGLPDPPIENDKSDNAWTGTKTAPGLPDPPHLDQNRSSSYSPIPSGEPFVDEDPTPSEQSLSSVPRSVREGAAHGKLADGAADDAEERKEELGIAAAAQHSTDEKKEAGKLFTASSLDGFNKKDQGASVGTVDLGAEHKACTAIILAVNAGVHTRGGTSGSNTTLPGATQLAPQIHISTRSSDEQVGQGAFGERKHAGLNDDWQALVSQCHRDPIDALLHPPDYGAFKSHHATLAASLHAQAATMIATDYSTHIDADRKSIMQKTMIALLLRECTLPQQCSHELLSSIVTLGLKNGAHISFAHGYLNLLTLAMPNLEPLIESFRSSLPPLVKKRRNKNKR
eukprot:TRINITY_DN33484_c0_g1_i1.p1 TRINITY_DN33484_c0_g1~~TRINITY_DN33484_c0_g1_i1.p1  ORF type:complete len:361 (-),score=73.65 TRINITY_DN33484_c0_g1_i1:260-1342(-)